MRLVDCGYLWLPNPDAACGLCHLDLCNTCFDCVLPFLTVDCVTFDCVLPVLTELYLLWLCFTYFDCVLPVLFEFYLFRLWIVLPLNRPDATLDCFTFDQQPRQQHPTPVHQMYSHDRNDAGAVCVWDFGQITTRMPPWQFVNKLLQFICDTQLHYIIFA